MEKNQKQQFMCLMNLMKLLMLRMQQDLEVTQAEFITLVAIAERSRCCESGKVMSASTSEVARHIGATRPAVSKVVRNLSMKGYVRQVQSKSDRRITHLALTEKGNRILEREFGKKDQLMQKGFEEFGEEKTDQLLTLMEELFGLMEKEAEKRND